MNQNNPMQPVLAALPRRPAKTDDHPVVFFVRVGRVEIRRFAGILPATTAIPRRGRGRSASDCGDLLVSGLLRLAGRRAGVDRQKASSTNHWPITGCSGVIRARTFRSMLLLAAGLRRRRLPCVARPDGWPPRIRSIPTPARCSAFMPSPTFCSTSAGSSIFAVSCKWDFPREPGRRQRPAWCKVMASTLPPHRQARRRDVRGHLRRAFSGAFWFIAPGRYCRGWCNMPCWDWRWTGSSVGGN